MSHPNIRGHVPTENFLPETFLLEPTLSPRNPDATTENTKTECCDKYKCTKSTCDVHAAPETPARANVESSKADKHEIRCDEILHDAVASQASNNLENDTSTLILKANTRRIAHAGKLTRKKYPEYSITYTFVVCAVLYIIPGICFGIEIVVIYRVLYNLLRASI
jgi:hypothetical protein